jgi:hypothetical protein
MRTGNLTREIYERREKNGKTKKVHAETRREKPEATKIAQREQRPEIGLQGRREAFWTAAELRRFFDGPPKNGFTKRPPKGTLPIMPEPKMPWPHCPTHRLAERGAYFVTCSTYERGIHGVLRRGLNAPPQPQS